jgi:hypothetical protein
MRSGGTAKFTWFQRCRTSIASVPDCPLARVETIVAASRRRQGRTAEQQARVRRAFRWSVLAHTAMAESYDALLETKAA